MRGLFTALLGLCVLVAGCGEAEAPEAVDERTVENREEARQEVLDIPDEPPVKD